MLLSLTGCNFERLFPQKVADGISRLTVLNIGAALAALSIDQRCGFKDPDLIRRTISRETGSDPHLKLPTGYATQTVDGCTLEFDKPVSVGTDCYGVETIVQGRFTIKGAHQTRKGILTGVNYQPVLPEGNSPVHLTIDEIEFDNFKAYFSNKPNQAMTIQQGSARISAQIHLVKSKKTAICSVPAPNLSIHAIEFNPNKLFQVELPGVFSKFTAIIDSGYLNHIQVGDGVSGDLVRGNNTLSGTLSVWENTVHVPSDGLGLDPEYNADEFNGSYLCESLDADESRDFDSQFDCSASEFVAVTAARLLVQNTGGILSEVSSEKHKPTLKTGCGISSQWNGWKNGLSNEAEGTFQIPVEACEIGQPETVLDTQACQIDGEFVAEHAASCLRKCNDFYQASPYEKKECRNMCKAPYVQSDSYIKGHVTVTGKAIIEGSLSWGNFGHTRNIKSPTNTNIFLDNVQFDEKGFSYFSKTSGEKHPSASLLLKNGSLSAGPLTPWFSRKFDSEDCALENPSPIVEMDHIQADNLDAVLVLKLPAPTLLDATGMFEYPTHSEAQLKTFSIPFSIDSSDISAVNGNNGMNENSLAGDITINERPFHLKNMALQPDYDAELFEAAYVCNNIMPINAHLMDGCEDS